MMKNSAVRFHFAFLLCFTSLNTRALAQGQTDAVELPPRTVPIPAAISEELQAFIRKSEPLTNFQVPESTDSWREIQRRNDRDFSVKARELWKSFEISVERRNIGGVPCFILKPPNTPAPNRKRLLVHVHGGAYVFAAGEAATWEASFVCHACKTTVISIDYRMPPSHPFPAAIEDTVAVWREVIDENEDKKLGLFGSSAGGGLALASLHQLRDLNLRQPDGVFLGTPWSDLTKTGDTYYTNEQLDSTLGQYEGLLEAAAKLYAGEQKLSDPGLSPINGDFSGLPPTILISGTRDLFLSNTVRTHRKLRQAGVPADLHIFEGQSHGHYVLAYPCPESDEAMQEIAGFFDRHLSRKPR